MFIRFQAMSILLGVLTVGLSGCGGSAIDTARVEGIVRFQGAPVEGANVMFTPVEQGQGSPAYAITDPAGRFKLQTQLGAPGAGTTPGNYRVTVSKVEMVGTGKQSTTPEGEQVEIEEPKELLPTKYKFQSSTPLTATVVDGQANVFEFDLES